MGFWIALALLVVLGMLLRSSLYFEVAMLIGLLGFVGTVVLSLGASFGLSVLIWQHIIGLELHWMVLAMAVIILLAVGADYNLSRRTALYGDYSYIRNSGKLASYNLGVITPVGQNTYGVDFGVKHSF